MVRQPTALTRQNGMTLVVVLIFLLLLTLLGVGSMSTTNLQERMAANSQSQTNTFQTAESAIAHVIATNTAFDTVMASANQAATTSTITVASIPSVTTTSFVSESIVQKISLGNCIVANTFDIDANATNASTGAHAHNTQSVNIIGPGACNQ